MIKQLLSWWRWKRTWYVYNWNFRLSGHPWYAIWHRSEMIRDFYSWKYSMKLKFVARFIVKHKMWWNHEDEKRWGKLI